jgi:hypothetical protein
VPLPDVVLFSTSAEAKPATFTLATDVLRFPPLDGRAPVSDTDSEIPSAFAFKATASPLNVVAAWVKPASGLKAIIAVRKMAIVGFFLMFMCTFPFLESSFDLPTREAVRKRPPVG